jgi:hypothetical protein
MSISRTKVNALVDDDGSGAVGTQWAKARVVDIYDDIDAYVGPFGTWQTRAYAGGNYTANGSMTWGVDSGDIVKEAFRRFEKSLIFQFNFGTTTVGGTPNTDLEILLPLGLIASGVNNGWLYYIENATHGQGLIQISASGTKIRLLKNSFANWTALTNLVTVIGRVELETTT